MKRKNRPHRKLKRQLEALKKLEEKLARYKANKRPCTAININISNLKQAIRRNKVYNGELERNKNEKPTLS